jgi:hypothetical protein
LERFVLERQPAPYPNYMRIGSGSGQIARDDYVVLARTKFLHFFRVRCRVQGGAKLGSSGFTERLFALSGIRDQRLVNYVFLGSLAAATILSLAAGVLWVIDASSSEYSPISLSTPALQKQIDSSRAGPSRPAESHMEGSAAVSAETSGALFFDGPFARWNALAQYEQLLTAHSSRPDPDEPQIEHASAGPGGAQAFTSDGVPLPRTRPALSDRETVQTADTNVSSANPAEKPSGLLEKLLALVRPEPAIPPEATGKTAVYDISARTLFMPSGERLEAHSGLGSYLDDPARVKEKAKGPTPPNAYRLSMRESLFHGIQAIRMIPVDNGKMYGRAGILAHPYMLGPDGSSNGCVSIQNYPKFLEAFQKGEIERLVVVSGANSAPQDLEAHRGAKDRRVAAY